MKETPTQEVVDVCSATVGPDTVPGAIMTTASEQSCGEPARVMSAVAAEPQGLRAESNRTLASAPARPFYTEYAWACDLLIDRPVRKECGTLETADHEHSSDYEFVMRCWTSEELQSLLALAGFHRVAYFGAYDPGVPAGATDRLVIVPER